MRLDYVIPGSIDRSAVTGSEPVTLTEAKSYLRIGFADDDELIGTLISAAREWAENNAGISIVSRTISCTIRMGSECHSLELPYGPVVGTPTGTWTSEDATALTADNFTKGPFPRLTGVCGLVDVTYTAGYETVPTGLKTAILAKLADLYENRGDTTDTNYGQVAKSRLRTYKRITAWV